jgi:hypothetical protein
MFKSEEACKGCNNTHYIQNKKHHLCSECVYRKNHDGRSRQDIYKERADNAIVIKDEKHLKHVMKRFTKKQKEINAKYLLTCIKMDNNSEPICSGCLRHQGGDIKLSHSHIISRNDCKGIGREELIYDANNLRYHCMTFGNHEGCHQKWESPVKRHLLADYEKNMEYIKSVSEEMYNKYIVNK